MELIKTSLNWKIRIENYYLKKEAKFKRKAEAEMIKIIKSSNKRAAISLIASLEKYREFLCNKLRK